MDALFRPQAIPPVLQLQHSILRDMSRIRDCRPVWIGGDRICVATGLLSHPLPNGRSGCSKVRYQSHNRESPFVRSAQVVSYAWSRAVCAFPSPFSVSMSEIEIFHQLTSLKRISPEPGLLPLLVVSESDRFPRQPFQGIKTLAGRQLAEESGAAPASERIRGLYPLPTEPCGQVTRL